MRSFCSSIHGLTLHFCTAFVFLTFANGNLYGEDLNDNEAYEFIVDDEVEVDLSDEEKESEYFAEEEAVDSFWENSSSKGSVFRLASYENLTRNEESYGLDDFYYSSNNYWARTEALLWWGKGMAVPPLVTTSTVGTAQGQAGVLGQPNTSILFGDGNIVDDERWGGRIRFGKWLNCCQTTGIEGEYFALGLTSTRFSMASTGTPILARPFYNILTNLQDAQLIAFPGLVTGNISVDATSNMQSAGFRYLWNVCEDNMGCRAGLFGSYLSHSDYRVKFLAGYRYMRLDENLLIREQVTTVAGPVTDFDISDVFDTETQFHGGEFGFMFEFERCNWSLDVLTKLALGGSRQIVTISGATATTVAMVTTNASGGILAQRTNSGRFVQDKFAVVPEIGMTLGYQLNDCWKATFGYSFLYWSSVARPGDQIDNVVNPNLFPPEASPFSGALRPEFNHRATDFWVQGINFGLEYTW